MGMRFRKSKSFGPFRATLGKRGISTSVGGKGFRISKGSDGKIRSTVGIPGTGLSYTTEHGKAKRNNANIQQDPKQYSKNTYKVSYIVGYTICTILLVMSLLILLISKFFGIAFIILDLLLFIGFTEKKRIYKNYDNEDTY